MQHQPTNPADRPAGRGRSDVLHPHTTTDHSTTEQDEKDETAAADQVRDVAHQAKETARDVTEKAKQKVSETADEARRQVKSRLDAQTDKAGDRLGSVAEALRHTGQELRDQDQRHVADYADVAADQVDQFSHYLQDRSAGDLLNEVRRFAERQPEVAVVGALAAGFLLGRFLKSSQPYQQPQPRYQSGMNREGYTSQTAPRVRPASTQVVDDGVGQYYSGKMETPNEPENVQPMERRQ